jgi:hypothetical protein
MIDYRIIGGLPRSGPRFHPAPLDRERGGMEAGETDLEREDGTCEFTLT